MADEQQNLEEDTKAAEAAIKSKGKVTVEVDGLEVTISPRALRDVRVTRSLREVTSGRDEFAIHDIFDRVFGEQQEKIFEHLEEKDEDGVADIAELVQFFKKALKAANPNS